MTKSCSSILNDAGWTDDGWSDAATGAVQQAHLRGYDLDDPRGADIAFTAISEQAIGLPLPGAGNTTLRWTALAETAAVDVTLGRLLEAHADALAILAELGGRSPAEAGRQRWGVWAAEGPQSTVRALKTSTGYELVGDKPWCSGAGFCTHALVTAEGPDGSAMYAVELDAGRAHPRRGSWKAVGLAGTGTELVTFSGLPAVQIGGRRQYLDRAGFWPGAIGVAAVWWGAAAGVAGPLYAKARAADPDPHALAHLGHIQVSLTASRALLLEAAEAVDRSPDTVDEGFALTARSAVEAAASQVLERVGRALGPSLLCQDRGHARRVADLTVYLRQSHAERDLEQVARALPALPRLARP